MKRSGAFLTVMVASACLAGCAPTPQVHDAGSSSSAQPVDARSCPAGFFDALTEHLEAPTPGDFPEVRLIEEPDYAFRPDALNDTVRGGCVFRVERESPAGDIMVQVFGVTSGADESQVVSILESAEWVQPFPETEPGAYESEERDPAGNAELESIGIFPVRGPDFLLAFTGWSEYFDVTEVVLQSVPQI